MAKRSYFCVLAESLHMIPVVRLDYTGVHLRWCKIFHRQNVFAEDFTRVETIVDYYLVTSNFCGQK